MIRNLQHSLADKTTAKQHERAFVETAVLRSD
jgi:hypothetical protein